MSLTILITGAGSGFGKLMAEAFAREGANVIATMRNVEEKKKTFEKKDNITFVELDINDSAQREKLKNLIAEKANSKLDVLINNAGYGAYGALEDAQESFIAAQFETNFHSTAALTREMLPFIREAKGKIIFFSSIMGITSMPLSSLYSASKFAVEGLAQGLYYELAPFGVQVCTVCPGRHRTNFGLNIQWPLEKIEDSAYSRFYQGLKKMMDSFKNGKEIPASNVSEAVVKLVKAKKIPSRLLVGKDAKALYLMQKLLPHEVFMKMTKSIYLKGLLK